MKNDSMNSINNFFFSEISLKKMIRIDSALRSILSNDIKYLTISLFPVLHVKCNNVS